MRSEANGSVTKRHYEDLLCLYLSDIIETQMTDVFSTFCHDCPLKSKLSPGFLPLSVCKETNSNRLLRNAVTVDDSQESDITALFVQLGCIFLFVCFLCFIFSYCLPVFHASVDNKIIFFGTFLRVCSLCLRYHS